VSQIRIVLIDDNPDDRLLALRQLQREFSNLNVEEIIDAEGLNQALDAGNFDLTITDYQLGWSNGITVLRAFKERYPDRPVVMFTNSGTEEIAVEAMKAGLDDYIIKSPKQYIRLARAVRSVLERVWQRQALEEAETRYRQLFEEVPVGLYRTTPSGEILAANPAAAQMLGYPDRQSLLSVKLADLYVDASHRVAWQEGIQQQGVLRNFEVQLRRGDGTIIWVLSSARAIRDSKEQLLYYEGAIEDITERKRIESERAQLLVREQEARTQAEAANRMKDEFLATISHELRTPLNAILGWAKMLHSRNFDPQTTARALEVIERNAVAQAKLVEELLDISRIIRGQLALDIRPVDLRQIVSAAIDTITPAADAKGIDIICILDPAASSLIGDPDRLQQVVWNLLSNALKFTPKGGRVKIELTRTDNDIQLRVSDTGSGIAAEFLPYMFDRFRQADSSTTRSHGGLGLGLAIVRHLVELHGGTVSAESAGEGKGATFTVLLPLHKDERGTMKDKLVSPSSLNPDTGSFRLYDVQVLVVDDEPDSRDLIVTVLQQEGAKVRAVASVKEALAALERQLPDVLISDIGMPEADGYALIRQLRSQWGQLPAIALTAYAGDEDQQQAIAAGFQRHLSKPIDPEELVIVVANLTGRSGKV
jgi:PAS domain S-box-containing protein